MDSDFLRLARRVKNLEGSSCSIVSARLTGEMLLWPGTAPPDGWLFCDGAAISRVDFAALFTVIGILYGGGDGSTTFNLPDLKGKVAVGYHGADGLFDVLGETGGEKTHSLTTSEMPTHTHVQNSHSHTVSATVNTAGDHSHYIKWYSGEYISLSGNGSGESSSGYRTGYTSGTVYHEATKAASAGGHSHGVNVSLGGSAAVCQSAGVNGSHNNLQPYVVLNYIIKS